MFSVHEFAAPIVHAFRSEWTQSSVLPCPSMPMCELACEAGLSNHERIAPRSAVVPGRSALSVEGTATARIGPRRSLRFLTMFVVCAGAAVFVRWVNAPPRRLGQTDERPGLRLLRLPATGRWC